MELFYDFCGHLGDTLKTHAQEGWVLIVILAVAISGFVSALYTRLPAGKKVFLFISSECPFCRTVLKFRDQIPLISFLLRRGKCRYCQASLPLGILMVEAASIFIPCLMYFFYGPSIGFVAYTFCFLTLFILAAIDLNDHVLPDEITLKGIAVGMLLSYLFPVLMRSDSSGTSLLQSALGFLTGIFLAGTIRFAGDLFVRQEVLGLGDVMLMGMVGAFLGIKLTVVAFFLSPLLSFPVALNFWVLQRKPMMPYAPFIASAAVLSLYFGDTLIEKFRTLMSF